MTASQDGGPPSVVEGALVIRECLEPGFTSELELREISFATQTKYQHVIIGQTPFGKGLFLDHSSQSFELDEEVYHSALVQPAMFYHRSPRRVLIGGGGEGATAREALRHPEVEAVAMVDLDQELVEACREHLPEWHRGALDDPRVALFHEDIRAYLVAAKQRGERFDVMIHDLVDPRNTGPARRCFTREFFGLVDQVLGDDGVLAVQAGEFDSCGTAPAYHSLIATLREVYEHVRPYRCYIHSFASAWGFIVASHRPLPRCPEGFEARWQAIDEKRPWREYDIEGHRAMMSLSPAQHERLAKPALLITDAD